MTSKKFPWQQAGVILAGVQVLLSIAHMAGRHRRPVEVCLLCHAR
jgi:hypothetical protein